MASLVDLPLKEGDVVAGKYRIDAAIGIGGMGIVFAATHLQLRDRVALKLLRSEAAQDEASEARFLREAQAAVRIKSENVARILDVGTHAGTPFIVMELLEGIDLRSLLKQKGPLPQVEAVGYVIDACRAIGEAHALGIIHRDIKPANLFLTQRPDGTKLVKVLDFGISKATISADGTRDQELTQTSTIVGSPHYISPEQARSSRSADARSDVWSLGIVLYNLLTGTYPFHGDTMTDTLVAVMTASPAPIRSLRDDIHPLLEAVILRCLSKDPAGRPQTVTELAEHLAPFRVTTAFPPVRAPLPTPDEAIPIDEQPTAGTWAGTWAGGATMVTPPEKRRSVAGRVFGGFAVVALVLVVAGLALRARSRSVAPASPPPAAATSIDVVTAAAPVPVAAATASATATEAPITSAKATATPSASTSAPARTPVAAPRPATISKPRPTDMGGLIDTRK